MRIRKTADPAAAEPRAVEVFVQGETGRQRISADALIFDASAHESEPVEVSQSYYALYKRIVDGEPCLFTPVTFHLADGHYVITHFVPENFGA